jgi:hypothetical protein
MAFRIKETACILIAAAASLSAAELRYEVRHEHLRKGCAGTLVIDEHGVSFTGRDKKKTPHAWSWEYQNIQQLSLAPKRARILTYTGRNFEFRLASGPGFEDAYRLLRSRLDQRFVAMLADQNVAPRWEIPAKLLSRRQGSEGLLVVGEDRIVYKTEAPDASRTWRFEDIDNLSSSGPFQLTLTTFERVRSHYGDRKGFNFQLKQVLNEARYNQLWRALYESKTRRNLQP